MTSFSDLFKLGKEVLKTETFVLHEAQTRGQGSQGISPTEKIDAATFRFHTRVHCLSHGATVVFTVVLLVHYARSASCFLRFRQTQRSGQAIALQAIVPPVVHELSDKCQRFPQISNSCVLGSSVADSIPSFRTQFALVVVFWGVLAVS